THETSIDELCAIIATALEEQRTRTNSTAITHVGRSSPDTNAADDIRYGDAIRAKLDDEIDTSAPR
ncbi:MAG: hypothetical protein ABI867_41735, partial [Kofleriaceae bacterium]